MQHRTHVTHVGIAGVSLGLLLVPAIALAGRASITLIDPPPGFDGCEAVAITNDGLKVVGNGPTSSVLLSRYGEWRGGFVWTRALGTQPIPGDGLAGDISPDGRTIVGKSLLPSGTRFPSAVRWVDGGGPQVLVRAPGALFADAIAMVASDLAPSGQRVYANTIGLSSQYVCVDAAVWQGAGSSGASTSLAATQFWAGSDDGRFVAGNTDRACDFAIPAGAPFRWDTQSGELVRLGRPVEAGPLDEGFAYAISADGAIVGGSWNVIQEGVLRAFLWTPAAGTRLLARPAWGGNTRATALSRDARLVAGSVSLDVGPRQLDFGVVWRGASVDDLGSLLIAQGAAMPPSWRIEAVHDMTPDGRVLVGTVYTDESTRRGFYAVMGTPCPADISDARGTGIQDDAVTIDDLLFFFRLFVDGAEPADLDDGTSTGTRDGGVTIDDLLYFLERFTEGC